MGLLFGRFLGCLGSSDRLGDALRISWRLQGGYTLQGGG
jgi:hypothetical protein